MSVRLLPIILTYERLDKDITDAFRVLSWHILALKDSKADLKVVLGLFRDVPDFANVAGLGGWIDVKPEIDHALVKLTTLVV